MKYKYLVCALIYVGLCSIDCYFSNVPMLNSIGQMGITEDVIFLNMHNSGSNFCGIKEILVVDTIPVLLGIYYALDKEKTYILKCNQNSEYIEAGSKGEGIYFLL